jgi:ferritin-like metal-binding protein YciE
MSWLINLGELFLHTLKDVYFAEHEILKTLPLMAQAAKNGRLKQAFDKHRSCALQFGETPPCA